MRLRDIMTVGIVTIDLREPATAARAENDTASAISSSQTADTLPALFRSVTSAV